MAALGAFRRAFALSTQLVASLDLTLTQSFDEAFSRADSIVASAPFFHSFSTSFMFRFFGALISAWIFLELATRSRTCIVNIDTLLLIRPSVPMKNFSQLTSVLSVAFSESRPRTFCYPNSFASSVLSNFATRVPS